MPSHNRWLGKTPTSCLRNLCGLIPKLFHSEAFLPAHSAILRTPQMSTTPTHLQSILRPHIYGTNEQSIHSFYEEPRSGNLSVSLNMLAISLILSAQPGFLSRTTGYRNRCFFGVANLPATMH